MDEKWICAKAKVKFLVIFFTLVEMRLIPAGRCVTMPVWFTVCVKQVITLRLPQLRY